MNDSRRKLIKGVQAPPILASIRDVEDCRNIFCSSATGLGDVMMVSSAIAALKERYPSAKLTWLAYGERGGREMAKLIPAIDECIDIQLGSYKFASITYMFNTYWRLVKELKKRQFDLAICFMPNYVRRWILAGLNCPNWIYGNSFVGYPQDLAMAQLQLLGIDKCPQKSAFQIPTPTRAGEILNPDLPRPWIGVHPYVAYQWRRWNKFDELIDKLKKRPGTVILVGQSDNYKPISGIKSLVNCLSLSELFWTIGQCDALVTVDSGPMHMAFAMETPVVALFSVVNPSWRISAENLERNCIIYYPTEESESEIHIRWKKADENLQRITVAEVIDGIDRLLELNNTLGQ